MERLLTIATIVTLLFPNDSVSQIRYRDKVRFIEGVRIAETVGNELWPGFSGQPIPVLFVYDTAEYLVHHPNPPEGFVKVKFDTLLRSYIYERTRSWPRAILTCQLVGHTPTLVVGTAETLKIRSSTWIIKLLHERFHQLQFDDSLLRDISRLNLKVSENNFPYDSADVNATYASCRNALRLAVSQRNMPGFKNALYAYLKARVKFRNSLTAEEYSYFSMMVWMEGIAKYTEYDLLKHLVRYAPTDALLNLGDYEPFPELYRKEMEKELNYLNEVDLKTGRRVCWYIFGFAEGMLLDHLSTRWKEDYTRNKFCLENSFPRKYRRILEGEDQVKGQTR